MHRLDGVRDRFRCDLYLSLPADRLFTLQVLLYSDETANTQFVNYRVDSDVVGRWLGEEVRKGILFTLPARYPLEYGFIEAGQREQQKFLTRRRIHLESPRLALMGKVLVWDRAAILYDQIGEEGFFLDDCEWAMHVAGFTNGLSFKNFFSLGRRQGIFQTRRRFSRSWVGFERGMREELAIPFVNPAELTAGSGPGERWRIFRSSTFNQYRFVQLLVRHAGIGWIESPVFLPFVAAWFHLQDTPTSHLGQPIAFLERRGLLNRRKYQDEKYIHRAEYRVTELGLCFVCRSDLLPAHRAFQDAYVAKRYRPPEEDATTQLARALYKATGDNDFLNRKKDGLAEKMGRTHGSLCNAIARMQEPEHGYLQQGPFSDDGKSRWYRWTSAAHKKFKENKKE